MATPTPLPINDANMLRIIRELAQDSSKVRIKKHARQRMRERDITMPQVLACLRRGSIAEPAHESIKGDWKCTLRYQQAGDDVHMAVAIEKDDGGNWVAVVTVF